ncbi:MAG: OmpH family outer membrane protein [Ignavibacteriales bacterium]|nr:OmpH family outer membrane protein [Ignavibacteriales bacterium]MCF8314858.1 OmpH family outer membrane protein [Ignavibacteriales bacterium]MCF8436193.1 OmpH family outer membrane protein [Ignavibacteriales bacterium]
MRKFVLVLSLICIFAGYTELNAQLKIGFIDSDAIMDKLSDAQDAQKKLDALIAEWQEEMTKLENSWKAKYDDYEKRKLIMSDAKRVETEKELVKLEDEITNYRQKKFGVNGELFKNQEELMKPVQNKIFTAIQMIAEEEEFDYIFDRSGDIIFLFAKDEHDLTNKVLEKLQTQE